MDDPIMAHSEVTYVVDESGKKISVILPVAEYEELLVDLHDLAVVAERKEEETLTLDEMKERLKHHGKL